MGVTLNVDGGARGNPGNAGGGVVIRAESGERLFEAAYYFGEQTNNASEYLALLRGLEVAARFASGGILIHSDSELLVKQITGEYRVKNETLQRLQEQAQFLLIRLPGWVIKHVRREQNARADELANIAMDQRRDVLIFDAQASPSEMRPPEPPPAGGAADRTTSESAALAESKSVPERAAKSSKNADAGVPALDQVRSVRVIAKNVDTTNCPAGGPGFGDLKVGGVLSAGICVHAAHAILPTLLAVQNTDANEFMSVPTLSVRCSRRDCSAMFQIGPARSSNGVSG